MRAVEFAEDEYYHLYNRGIERRNIFLNEKDYLRFAQLLFQCNDVNLTAHASTEFDGVRRERKPIIEIVSWCLMPNHFHMLAAPLSYGAISVFMHRLLLNYSRYFNVKYKRSGHLFEGPFKAKHVDREEYFTHTSRYIHLNPVKLKESKWKTNGVKDMKSLTLFLEHEYRWSSFRDYIGQRQFPSVISSSFLSRLFRNPEEYKEFVYEWLYAGIPELYQELLRV